MSVIDRINSNLATLYDVDDAIYRRLIADNTKTIPASFSKPTDIDIGVIASQIEWLRKISLILIDQLYIDRAASEFLKYQLEEFFFFFCLDNESDVEWVQRTIAKVFQPKVSRAAIIVALRPYSSPADPKLEGIDQGSGFADFSFADCYNRATFTEISTKVNYYTQTDGSTIPESTSVLQYIPYIYEGFSFADILYPTSFYSVETTTVFKNEDAQYDTLSPIQTLNTENNITTIRSGNGVLIALSDTGVDRVKRSTDGGASWTAITTPNDVEWVDIAYGNGVWVAIAQSGTNNIMRSVDDGLTWGAVSAPESIEFTAIEYGAGFFVAVARTGDKRVIRSEDLGLTWTEIETPELNQFTDLSFGNNVFVAVAESGVSRSMRSTDFGESWSMFTVPENNRWQAITFGNNTFVAVSSNGSNQIMYSINSGASWNLSKTPSPSGFVDIQFGDDAFIAIARDGVNRVISSENNGMTWDVISASEGNDWSALTYDADAEYFYLTSFMGEISKIKRSFYDATIEQTVNVLPAVAEQFDSAFFSIKITLQNTANSDILTVLDIIENIIAAGISYQLFIEYT